MKDLKKGFLWLYSFLMLTAALPAHAQLLPDGLPSRSQRISAFAKADLEESTASLDELEQDLLYWRAGHQSLENLEARYPHLSPRQLQRLQAVLGVAK